jgi:hypothetical protein
MLAMTEGVIDPRVILGLNAAAEDDLAARPRTMTARMTTSTTISTRSSSTCPK